MSLTARALFIIERNLASELTLAGIAQACGVSHYHLAHAFGKAAGWSVMDYVRGRRLSMAAHQLVTGTGGILDVALDSGYSSHEAFTRAFKAQFGQTPENVRACGSTSTLPLINALRPKETTHMTLEQPRIEKAGELLFVGLSELIGFGESQKIAGMWQRFMSGPYKEIALKTESIPVGISMIAGEGMQYMCAAEVTGYGKIPAGLTTLTVAPQTYLVFEHRGHVTLLDDTYAAIWNDWLPAHDHKPVYAPSLQRHNPAFDPRTGEGGVTVWIPVEG